MTAASVPAPSMFAVFRRRDFSLLWLAQLISTAGSALTDLAAGIYVFRVTGSALAVGLTLMVTAVPSLVVGLLAGVFVDRHDRKRIMIWTCLIQAVTVGAIALVLGMDAIAIPGLFVLLLINAGVKQFFDPAHDSLIPEMASDEELAAANSFLSIAAFGSTAIGFAGAGILASFDLRLAFVIDAASFVICALLLAAMGTYRLPVPEDEASPRVIIENLKSGLGTLFGTQVLRSLFLVGALMFFSFGLWNVLLLPMSLRELHDWPLVTERGRGENRRECPVDLAGVGLKRTGRRVRIDDSVSEQLRLLHVRAQVGDRKQLGRSLVDDSLACSHALLVGEDRCAAEEQHRQQHDGHPDSETTAERVPVEERCERIGVALEHLLG